MNREQLKAQAIFRLVMFFAITIVIGFVISDINILSSQWGINMFKISPETKEAALVELNKLLPGHTPDELDKAFEEVVSIVKKQFGM